MKKLLFSLFIAQTFTSQSLSAQCIEGKQLVYNDNDAKPSAARESLPYNRPLMNFKLSYLPDYQNADIYIIAQHDSIPWDQAPIYFEDWCYEPETNQIHFKRTPRLLFWDEIIGEVPEDATLWVGYHSASEYNEECILGIFFEGIPPEDSNEQTENFQIDYELGSKGFHFPKLADPTKKIVLYNPYSNTWVSGYDWCYAPLKNEIRYLTNPLRSYILGAIPGHDMDSDEGLWTFYSSRKP